MTLKVVPIAGCMDVPAQLRDLADKIEEANDPAIRVTLVVGRDVYCWGPVDNGRAAESAIFDMTYGIHKLMELPVKLNLEKDGW
jgi:hypothetical protein